MSTVGTANISTMEAIYEYKKSVKAWEDILTAETEPRKRAEQMLEKGVITLGKGIVAFDPILTCEALGEAERADARDLQAEAYKRIGMLWGKQYPALSLSIWRNAEKLYKEQGNSQESNMLKLNLAHSCFLTSEKYEEIDKDLAKKYREEAKRIILTVTEPEGDDSTVASFKQTVGIILHDSSLIRAARSFYEQEGLWDAAIGCLDEEIRIALDGGDRQGALPLMRLVKDYALRLGDQQFAEDVEEKIAHIDELQNAPRILTKPVEEQTLLDVLDIISYFEERIIFEPIYKAEEVLGHSKGKQFQLLRDGRLMPLFREQMRLFRGESELNEPCRPTLWRKNMDEEKRFIQRLKLAEFKRMFDLLPDNIFFQSGIQVTDPDGRVYHVPLHIDVLSIAQHYGIKTELLDLTSDKWVAAFFACTTYDLQSDTYCPIVEKAKKPGVMYCYQITEQNSNEGRLRIVGAQPFERPTAQAAFMIEMEKDDDFNKLCPDRSQFRQDPMTSVIVYHYANRAGRMFPEELIQKKTHSLVLNPTKRFCPQEVDYVRRRYSKQWSKECLQQLLDGIEMGKDGEYLIDVAPEEQVVTQDKFMRFMRLLEKIDVRWYSKMILNRD